VALRELGVIESTVMRPPLTEVSDAVAAQVREALQAAGLSPVASPTR
jgi:dihydrodipicolinate synthase/N-acetylneuraminate lyase